MASTYTPLGVELQATGENAGTWGTKTNTNLQIVEQISGGYTTQAVTDGADTALTVSDGSTGATLSHRIIEFTGSLTASRNVTIPLDVQNFYFLKNATSGSQNVVFKYATGTGTSATVTNGKTVIAYAKADDGTNPNISTISLASDLVDDTSPQLGGNLDTNSFMIDFDDAHGIRDENGNEQLIFETTGSAVNHIDITNAATGSGPEIGAVGDDSNINLELKPKGTGEVQIGTGAATATLTSSGAYDLTLDTNGGTNSGTITITDGANGAITATPNGTGEVVVGGNTNPGTLVLNCESNSHGIKLQSPPHSSSQSYTLKFPTGNVTADRFLKVASITGSGTTAVGQLSFAEVSGGTSYQAVKTSGFTAVAGEGYFCNTTSAAFTATLPGSATIGDEITFIDYAGTFDTNNLTIGRNSHNIQGAAADLTVSTERAGFTLVYVDSTQGWLLKDK
jgi:hypothetical protein